MPPPPTTVTITTNNITDRAGNAITSAIQNTFTPSSGNVPVIALYHPEGPQKGDVTIQHVITDDENNPVWLLTEYQLPGQSTWNAATITGDTTDIAQASYTANLVWDADGDIPNAEYNNVEFRVRIRDNGTSWGGSDSAFIDIDNTPPAWVKAEGNSGDSEFYFWFDEVVSEATATNTTNFTLTGGNLTISSIDVSEDWTTQAISIPAIKRDPGVGELDGLLYVVGGYVSGSYSNTVQVYDPDDGSWSSTAPMPSVIIGVSTFTGPYDPVVIGLNGKLYVMGGYWQGTRNWIHVYDPDDDSWTRLADAPRTFTVWNAQGGVIQGKIYLNHDSSRILVYDPNTDTWEDRAGGFNSSGVAAAVINDKLYMAGGTAGTDNACLVYDPVAETLSPLANMPTPRYNAAGVAIAGKFYVFGGYQGGELSTVDVYDPVATTWTTLTSATNVSQEHRGAVVNGVFYFGVESGETAWFDAYDRTSFVANLGAGQTMPAPPTSYTLSASSIVDLVGNTTASTLNKTFTSSTGTAPAIVLYPPTGTRTGDINISHVLTDDENNPLWLKAEYRLPGTSTWVAAATTGTKDSINSAGYEADLTWNTGTDLSNSEYDGITFRVSVKDGTTWAASYSVLIDVDNLGPSTLVVESNSGDTSLLFWFNEPVSEATATSLTNVTLLGSSGLTASGIQAQQLWTDNAVTVPTSPLTRYEVGMAELDGKIYIVGGYSNSDNQVHSTLQVYDPASSSWDTKPSMSYDRKLSSVVGLNGKLYVFGGQDRWGNNQTYLEVYDPIAETWTIKTTLPFNASQYVSPGVAINGKIYLMDWQTIHIYDPPTDTWDSFTTNQTGRNGVSLQVIGDQFYIVGGEDGTILNEVFLVDVVAQTVTPTSNAMPTARHSAVTGVIDGKLYVIGGQTNGGTNQPMVEIFNPASGTWTTGLTGRDFTYEGNGVAIDDKIYFGRIINPGERSVLFDVYSRNKFELTLTSGMIPPPPATVVVSASNISDWTGNTTTAALTDTVSASTGNAPSIYIYQPSGVQAGDVKIRYEVQDDENNPVDFSADFSKMFQIFALLFVEHLMAF